MKVFEEYVHDRTNRMLGYRVDTILLTNAELTKLDKFAQQVGVSAETFLDYEVTIAGDVDIPALLLYYNDGADVDYIRTWLRLYYES